MRTIFALYFLTGAGFLFAPALYNSAYIADLFPLTDGVMRIGWGQMPHRDFQSPIGFLNYYAPFIMVKMGVAPLLAIRALCVVMAGFALMFLVYLKRTRLSNNSFIYACGLLLLLLLSQMNLGDHYIAVTVAMFYNRFGFAGVVLAFCFVVKPKRDLWWGDGLLAGLLIFTLFSIKFTYALVALGILLYAFMIGSFRLKALALMVGLCLFLTLLCNIHGQITYYIADIGSTLNSAEKPVLGQYIDLITGDYLLILLALGLPLYDLWGRKVLKLHHILLAGFLGIAGVLLTASNAQWGNIFLPLAFMIIVLDDENALTPWMKVNLAVVVVVFFLPFAFNISLALQGSYKKTHTTYDFGAAGVVHGQAVSLDDLKIARDLWSGFGVTYNRAEKLLGTRATQIKGAGMGVMPDHWYLDSLHAGLDVARQCEDGKSFMTIDYANPFNLLLNRKPTGQILFVYPSRTISESVPPPFKVVFGEAECIMLPHLPHSLYSQQYLMKHYHGEAKNFEHRFISHHVYDILQLKK